MLHRELDRYPWNDRIAEQLAILLGMRGAWEEALDRLIRALVLGPDDPPRWALLGVVLRELGHEEESRLASSLASIAQ